MPRLLDTMIAHPRQVPTLIMASCVGALGTAFASEAWGGLAPCVLCIYQRWAFAVAFLAALIGAILGTNRTLRRVFIALAGLAFLGGAGVAGFHVGVEQQWWRGTEECTSPVLDSGSSVETLKQALLQQDFVACDSIPWSLFGISIAGYNVIASLLLAAACFWVVARLGRAPHH